MLKAVLKFDAALCTVREFVLNSYKCYSRGYVHITKLVTWVVGSVPVTLKGLKR